MSEANRLDSISGWKNAKTFFWWLALPGHRRESLRCIAARGSRALWDQRQCGGDLGAALETNRKLYGKAEWRQHFTAGRSHGILAGFDCQAARPDVGRDRCGDGETRNRVQPHRGLAVLRSPQHQL